MIFGWFFSLVTFKLSLILCSSILCVRVVLDLSNVLFVLCFVAIIDELLVNCNVINTFIYIRNCLLLVFLILLGGFHLKLCEKYRILA
jgi:hypothetical protein